MGPPKNGCGLYLCSGAAPAAELAGNILTPPPGVSISIVVLGHSRPLGRIRTFRGLGWAGWAGLAGLGWLRCD